jgi:hypothetical protein
MIFICSQKDCGRGLIQIGAYIAEIIKLEEYVECEEDPPI